MALSIMIQGTASNAGKSLLAAALCRIFAQDGYSVAPFKSQNMALNSYVTADGLEMGRAQVMQAEAARCKPDVCMNPILLKPTSNTGSQVIVNGEVLGVMSAAEYFAYKHNLKDDIMKAYNSLALKHDIIVIEGAGSPAEINLNSDDIVNMGMAKMAKAPVLLAGDIDRGGVFASLYGTVALLEKEEQELIKGVIINKFRGDVEILRPGLAMLENLINKPVVGVVPYLQVDIDDEDSLSSRLDNKTAVKAVDIAVIKLPRMSNFTDFNSLERHSGVGVRYVEKQNELGNPDLLIIPGTKNTMADMLWLRQNGLEGAIKKLHAQNTLIIGVCGGYQILGKTLDDPHNVEQGGSMNGMGLLPIDTVFCKEKRRTQVTGRVNTLQGEFSNLSGSTFSGYEIHMGSTQVEGERMASLIGEIQDGCARGNVLGTYVHGIFDDGDFAKNLITIIKTNKGIDPDSQIELDFESYKNQQYDLLAKGARESLDMELIYKILKEGI